ncbi:MAG: hypothetical protein NVSMB18_31650 [Acetobacteraceae bacterium]
MRKRLWIVAVLVLAWGAGPAVAQPNPSFYLVNRSGVAINEVYATAAGLPNWGRDRLGNANIPPGQNAAIRLPADGNCIYDIKVVFANGQIDERRALDTCALDNLSVPRSGTAPANPPGGGSGQQATSDPSFRLINRGRSEVNEVFATPVGTESWGADRLGDDTVPAGSSKVIRLPMGTCIYDLRVVFADGEATERRRVNLCATTDLRVP